MKENGKVIMFLHLHISYEKFKGTIQKNPKKIPKITYACKMSHVVIWKKLFAAKIAVT